MKSKTTTQTAKSRPNYLLGLYILGISFFMITYSLVTALQYL